MTSETDDGRYLAIWRGVILRAFLDALAQDCVCKSGHGGSMQENLTARREARKWLTRSAIGFEEVCALAAVDASCVRALALDLEARDWPHDEARRFRYSGGDGE